MSPLQKYLQRAAAELDLRIEIAHAVTLSDGRILISQVLFPDLGNHSGTIVFTVEDKPNQSARGELLKRQYATSIMSGVIPKNSVFDIESNRESKRDIFRLGLDRRSIAHAELDEGNPTNAIPLVA